MDSLAARVFYTSYLIVLSLAAVSGNLLLLITTAQKRLKRLSCITQICASVGLCNILYSLLVLMPRAVLIHWHSATVCKIVAFAGFYFYLVTLLLILATAIMSCWKSFSQAKPSATSSRIAKICRSPMFLAWIGPMFYVAMVVTTGTHEVRWKALEFLCSAQNWTSRPAAIATFALESTVFLSTPIMFLLLAHRIKLLRNQISPTESSYPHQKATRTVSNDSAVLLNHEKRVMKMFSLVMLTVTTTGFLQESIAIAFEANRVSDTVFLLGSLLRWSFPLIMSVLNIMANKTVRERLRLSQNPFRIEKFSHMFDHLVSVWHKPISRISFLRNPTIVIQDIPPSPVPRY